MADPIRHRVPAQQESGEHRIGWHNQTHPFAETYATVHVAVVPCKHEVCLVSIVVRISDVAEQTFAELRLCHFFYGAEVEDLERFLAGEVTTVGQVTLELLNFLL